MMKRLFLAAIVGVLCAACGDDSYSPDPAPAITIVRSDLVFEPQGRTGSVEVQAGGTVTAELSSDWCEARVEGRVVQVTVQDNPTFEGRTALLTIKADGAQLTVPVQQRGMALGSLSVSAAHIGSNGGRQAYYIRHDLPVHLDTADEWIHPRMEGDSLIIDIEPNADAYRVRRGLLTYECAGYTGELSIVQYDRQFILGQYYLGGSMGGADTGFRFNLVERDGRFYMVFFRLEDWKDQLLPVDFDEDRCVLTMHSGTVIWQKDVSNYDVFYFYGAGGVAASEKATMNCELYYNPFMGSNYATLEDGGTWGGEPLTGFIILMVRYMVPTPLTLVQLDNPYIVWLGDAAEV